MPKLSTTRHGHSPTPVDRIHVPGGGPEWEEPDPAWCPIARRWYLAARDGGMAGYRDEGDAASAFMWAEAIHRAFTTPRLSGQLLACIRAAEQALGMTVGDRRRLRVEVERGPSLDSARLLEKWSVVDGMA